MKHTIKEDGTCSICGGMASIHFGAIDSGAVIEDSGNGPELRIGNVAYKVCTGHHEPPLKHNGWLGDGERVSMWYWHGAKEPDVDVLLDSESGPDRKHLTPKQALSLLEWLKQEEATLQKLVEEEEEKK